MPVARPFWFAVTCRVAGVAPLSGEALSQVESLLSEKARPEVVEERLRLCAGGAVPPVGAVNWRLAGDTLSWLVDG